MSQQKKNISQGKLVSVIIPAYNAERHIKEAIESVLTQDYRPLELIVVDDGSTDRTAQIIKDYEDHVRYVHQVNSGTASARNTGIKKARGVYLAHLDADDLWVEGRLSLQVRALEENPSIDAVSGHVRTFYSPELDDQERRRIWSPEKPVPGHVIPGMLIRSESCERIGAFRSKWSVGSDLDWFIRAREKGFQLLVLPEVVLLRRLHEANKGRVRKDQVSDRLHILKEALHRRRLATKASG